MMQYSIRYCTVHETPERCKLEGALTKSTVNLTYCQWFEPVNTRIIIVVLHIHMYSTVPYITLAKMIIMNKITRTISYP